MLIIQDDAFAQMDSVTIVPLTSTPSASTFLRVAIPADEQTGLAVQSWAMADKLSTVKRSSCSTKIGEVHPQQLIEVERVLVTFLGLAR